MLMIEGLKKWWNKRQETKGKERLKKSLDRKRSNVDSQEYIKSANQGTLDLVDNTFAAIGVGKRAPKRLRYHDKKKLDSIRQNLRTKIRDQKLRKGQ